MSSIDGVISELAGIRNALGGEPAPRSRRRPGAYSPASERVTTDPIFDAGRWDIADQTLWEEKQASARGAVENNSSSSEAGIEALAWYVSFHDNQRDWGIYIPLSSLALMDELYLGNLPIERDRRLHLAWSVLLHHEQAHFAVDHACAWFELMLRAPIRREFRSRFKAEPPLRALTASYLEIEESAANAHMLRQLRHNKSHQIVRTIEEFVRRQPAGYREGVEASDDAAFAEATAETLRSYLALWAIEHRLDLGNGEMNLSRLLPLQDKEVLAECPVYAIDDLRDVGVRPGSIHLIQCIPNILETKKFKRQLQHQNQRVQSDWSQKREEIKERLPSHPKFKKLTSWEPPTWSLWLCNGHRVHLQPPDSETAQWRAVAIGSHKEMGHG